MSASLLVDIFSNGDEDINYPFRFFVELVPRQQFSGGFSDSSCLVGVIGVFQKFLDVFPVELLEYVCSHPNNENN